MSAPADPRLQALIQTFTEIAATRMQGLPVMHPGLQVEAVGFRTLADGALFGILITPWFMNLVWLPPTAADAASRVGDKRSLTLGPLAIELITAREPPVGAFECCSLYSPLHQFADQAAVRATATQVLSQLAGQGAFGEPAQGPALSRRSFLRGSRAASEGR